MTKPILAGLSAALVATSCLLSVPVLAQDASGQVITQDKTEEVSEKTIKTADDFIKAFAGKMVQKISSDQNKKLEHEEEFVWFEKADQTNFAQLLKGNEIFKKLDTRLQEEILKVYTDKKLDYDLLIKQALEQQDLYNKEQERLKQEAEQQKKAQEQAALEEAGSQENQQQSSAEAEKTPSRPENTESSAQSGQQPSSETSKTETPSAPVKPSDQTSDTNTPETKPEIGTPSAPAEGAESAGTSDQGAGKDVQDAAWTTLSQTSLNGTGSLSGQKIALSLQAKAASFEEGLNEAAQALASEKGLVNANTYDQAIMSASLGTLQASSAEMKAINDGTTTVLFTAEYQPEEEQYVLSLHSDKSVSFDMTSGLLNTADDGQFVYHYQMPEQPEQAAPELKNEEIENRVEAPAAPEDLTGLEKPDAILDHLIANEDIKKPDNSENLSSGTDPLKESAPLPEAKTASALETAEKEEPLVKASDPVVESLNKTNPLQNTRSAVDTFLSAWLTENGTICKAATTSNYRRILSSFADWTKLTTQQKNEVNARLAAAGSWQYQNLFREANRIRLGLSSGGALVNGLNVSNGAHTSSATCRAWYMSLMAAMGALMISLERRLHRDQTQSKD